MANLELSGVSVEYPIYNSSSMSLRNNLIAVSTGGRIAQQSRRIKTVVALDNINLELKKGDRLALVGHNGAGKTTLLRTMAGIFQPTRGTVTANGKISTVFGLGAGLDVELTGYENIVRMSMLLGSSYSDAEASIASIEAFTELGGFLSMPVRTYSAGMTTRLLFAVATAVHPEILIVDEVLGAGDADFQEKAQRRMAEFIEKASIFVLASHSEALLKMFCNKFMKMEHGRQVEFSGA
ncbi:ABC transporter ATP-binding protein [Devosia sp. Root105]|uniref:ABC transporter ATP-binding protein n=1 Tax=Devosia sp. Root105 TaxID=1736423 RepID=UPI0006F2989A|nr:ABC transporter ATP-binding protein [Devosia sp. Root105]KQU92996.1 sugar ABC transporter ATP-binding protein [Devosia sp. Root105]